MSCNRAETAEEYLDELFNQVRPKARYISEMHVEEYVDSIYMELVNGDTEVSSQITPYHSHEPKSDFEEMLRNKIISDAAREKEMLEKKLQYLSNSINALHKYDEYRGYRSSKKLRESYSMHHSRPKEQWRKEMQERGKNIKQRKLKAEELKNKKQQQLKEVEERLKQEQNQKKKKQISDGVKNIEQRAKKRQEEMKEANDRYKQAKKQKRLFHRFSESFHEKQLSFLEQRKKKLAEIRSFHKPIDESELKQHETRFFQIKKQKQQMREREKKMNQSRSNSYQPFYKSVFYQKALEDSRLENQNSEQAKKQKMKQFSEQVKERYAPEIDDRKRQQIEDKIEKQKLREERKIQKEKELLAKPREKGIEYLDLVKKLPKRSKQKSRMLEEQAYKTQRREYPNYITHHKHEHSTKPWNKILSSDDNKTTKALHLQYESQRKEQQLKRKEQQVRLMKNGEHQDIDQGYFEMIKAKLDLLQAES